MAEIARAERDKLADPAGLTPTTPKIPAAPGAPTPPAAGQPPAAPADILSRYGVNPEVAQSLPPEAHAALAERLTSIDHGNHQWYEQVQQWGTQLEQRAQQAVGEAQQLSQRIERIASDPRFQLALQSITNPGAAGANAGGPAPQFETALEKQLWGELQQIKQFSMSQAQQTQRELQEQRAWREGQTAAGDKRALRESAAEITAAHKTLDGEFPELANDPQQRQAWHAKAADLLELQRMRGQEADLVGAMRDAATLLHYPHAQQTGATRALTAARTAARGSTLREQGGRTTPVRKGDQSMRQIAEQTAAEFAASAA